MPDVGCYTAEDTLSEDTRELGEGGANGWHIKESQRPAML